MIGLVEARSGFAVLPGDDPYLFPLTLMGATGAVALPHTCASRTSVEMIHNGLANRVMESRRRARHSCRWCGALEAAMGVRD